METRQLKKPLEPGKGLVRPSSTSGMPGLLSALMAAAPRFHKLHLKVKGPGSYAVHSALNSLYSDLPGHVDDLAEQYQGATETLLTIPEASGKPELQTVQEALSYLRELYDHVSLVQDSCPYSEINNTLDEVKSLINSSKYKLLFLA